jgi:hypothetical protein
MCEPQAFELSKIEAAVDQLDWAIRLFLDHQAFVPAITLAGAAEEIIGQAVGQRRASDALKKHLASELSITEKEASDDHVNFAKIWLKHWGNRGETEKARIYLVDEAIQYIVRALTNLSNYDCSVPSEGRRFRLWMETNRPELMAE